MKAGRKSNEFRDSTTFKKKCKIKCQRDMHWTDALLHLTGNKILMG